MIEFLVVFSFSSQRVVLGISVQISKSVTNIPQCDFGKSGLFANVQLMKLVNNLLTTVQLSKSLSNYSGL